MILLLFLLLTSAFSETDLEINLKYGKVLKECKPVKSAKKVILFKQWHLSSSTNTNILPQLSEGVKPQPQLKNQTAIYEQLDDWVREKKLKEVIAEGCSGELNRDSKLKFNGWSFQSLKEKYSDKNDESSLKNKYSEILSSVPLKLEAKYEDALLTRCGDDESLIKENALAFSDARGILGFLTRLVSFKEDFVRSKTYLDGTIDLYKLPKNTTNLQAIERLKSELKLVVIRIKEGIEKRNVKLVEHIKSSKNNPVAVVFGGMHTSGVVKLLEDSQINCTVVEPEGYEDNEVKLIEALDAELKKLSFKVNPI